MPLAGKPISAYRYRAPPPAWESRSRAVEKPPLAHFVFLSMLLHALFISLFGAPSGGSREGRALWGSLQVVLQDAPPAPAPVLKMDRSVVLSRPRETKAPRPSRRAPPSTAELKPTPALPPVELPRVEPVPEKVPFSMPPLLDRIMKPDPKLELPVLKVPAPTKEQSVRPPPPPAPPAPTPPAEAPVVAEEQPVQRVERVPTEAPPIAAPILQPTPLPLPERIAAPPVERAPPIESPAVPALPVTPPVQRAPVEVPAIPVPAPETFAPPRVEAAPKPVERAPVEEIPISPRVAPTPAPQREQPQVRETPPRIEREPPVSTPAAPSVPFSATLPSSRREAEPSSTYDPTAAPPSLDIDAVRRRAAALAREGTGNRAVLPFPMPPLPERKTKEQIAIEKARKPDCRTAYQGLGLAAVVPLIANEFGEGTCRW
jgi:hypothetical protein